MNKQAFLAQLRKSLSSLPQEDVEERVSFYSEMIDDRMEEGFSEEDAVDGIGTVDAIVSQIVADVPLTKLVKETMTPKNRLKAWEILLLILGSPIWFSLLIAVIAVVFSLYVALWSVIISLWAVFGSLIGCAFGGILAGIGFVLGGHRLSGMAMIAVGLVCAGLSVFLYYGSKVATKGTVLLAKRIVLWMKNGFIRKEKAECIGK